MPNDAFLRPEWCVDRRVGALMTTREGGIGAAPYDSFNLSRSVGDDADTVAENRRRFAAALDGARPVWLSQVHGARVLRLRADSRDGDTADAAVTSVPGIACAVSVADCLPVLFAAAEGAGVGAAHAGWRGLAAGVLEATVAALCEAAGCEPARLSAWLGPCIGPRRFEVGADVLEAFGDASAHRFERHRHSDQPTPRWLADLPGLARDRLQAVGVRRLGGGAWCTVEDASRFFSFRRDRVTGRMAAAVWLRGDRSSV